MELILGQDPLNVCNMQSIRWDDADVHRPQMTSEQHNASL